MYTRSSEGQVVQLIAVVFLFFIIIVFSIFQLSMLIVGGNIVDETIEANFEYQLGDTRRMSALQTSLSDQVSRTPSISDTKYEEVTAYELSSLYFGSENEVYLNGESFQKSEVGNDLEDYFEYKMDETWLSQGAYPVDYELVAGTRRDDGFSIVDRSRHSESNFNGVSLPVSVENQSEAIFVLNTRTKFSIFGVGDS